jgi:hypothetical protein
MFNSLHTITTRQVLLALALALATFAMYHAMKTQQSARFCLCRKDGGSDSESFQEKERVHAMSKACTYSDIYTGVI